MDNVVNNYQKVRNALTIAGRESGKPYLPEAKRVSVTHSPVVACSTPAELLTGLVSVFKGNDVYGWVTLQSNTLVITDKAVLLQVLENEYLVNGELSDGTTSMQLYFEGGIWHMATLNVTDDNNGDSLAFARHYALDGARFPAHNTGKIHYQIIWQHTSQGLAPVAQHLHSISYGDNA
jgi:hypothetical protein